MSASNRRRDVRLGISLPVRVKGHAADGKAWEEMTKCEDASSGGCSFVLRHEISSGQVLYLSLPLPRRFRRFDLAAASYNVYGIVMSTQHSAASSRVGLSFIGKEPPPGYDKHPGARFLPDRRRSRREPLFLKVHLSGDGRDDEPTVLEDFGPGGARVMTGQAFAEGDMVAIEDAEGSFRARGEIRSISTGRDGIRRLSLRFVSK